MSVRKDILLFLFIAAALVVGGRVVPVIWRYLKQSSCREIAASVEKQHYAQARELLTVYFSEHRVWHACGNGRKQLEAFLQPRQAYPLPDPGAEIFSYVERADWYHRITRRIAVPAEAKGTALALFDWTVRNVQSSGGPDEGAEIGIFPLDIIKRGYGLCDRTAWVFAALLQAAGMESCIIYLREHESGVSSHTIVGLAIDGEVYLFDTYVGLPVFDAETGKILTFAELMKQPEKLDGFSVDSERFPMRSSDFTLATFFLPLEADAVLPEIERVEEIVAEGGYSLTLYHSPKDSLRRLADVVFGTGRYSFTGPVVTAPSRGNQAALWDYPFRIRWLLDKDANYQEKIRSALSRARLSSPARLAQAAGDFEEARRICDGMMTSADGQLQEDALHILCLAEFEDGRFSRCAELAEDYLEKYPDGLWRTSATFLLARSLAQMKKTEEALQTLDKAEGHQRLRARVWVQALKQGKNKLDFHF